MTTVTEVRNAKADLERQVAELMLEFEKQTGLEARGVDGRRVFHGAPGEGEYHVSLEVGLV